MAVRDCLASVRVFINEGHARALGHPFLNVDQLLSDAALGHNVTFKLENVRLDLEVARANFLNLPVNYRMSRACECRPVSDGRLFAGMHCLGCILGALGMFADLVCILARARRFVLEVTLHNLAQRLKIRIVARDRNVGNLGALIPNNLAKSGHGTQAATEYATDREAGQGVLERAFLGQSQLA